MSELNQSKSSSTSSSGGESAQKHSRPVLHQSHSLRDRDHRATSSKRGSRRRSGHTRRAETPTPLSNANVRSIDFSSFRDATTALRLRIFDNTTTPEKSAAVPTTTASSSTSRPDNRRTLDSVQLQQLQLLKLQQQLQPQLESFNIQQSPPSLDCTHRLDHLHSLLKGSPSGSPLQSSPDGSPPRVNSPMRNSSDSSSPSHPPVLLQINHLAALELSRSANSAKASRQTAAGSAATGLTIRTDLPQSTPPVPVVPMATPPLPSLSSTQPSQPHLTSSSSENSPNTILSHMRYLREESNQVGGGHAENNQHHHNHQKSESIEMAVTPPTTIPIKLAPIVPNEADSFENKSTIKTNGLLGGTSPKVAPIGFSGKPPPPGPALPRVHALRYSSSTQLRENHKRTCGQRLKQAICSLRFVLMFTIVSALVVVSVLSWNLTLQACHHSINLVTNDYSSELLNQITLDVDRRLVALEHITELNKEYFALGVLSFSQPSAIFSLFLKQISVYVRDTASSMSMTTKAGELNGLGWYFPIIRKPYMVRWDQIGPNMTETEIDPITGAKRNVTLYAPNYNATKAEWYTVVNMTDVNSSGWTEPYLFYGNWFISTSRTLLDSAGDVIGCITCDMQLGFTDIIAKQLASTSSVGAQFIILNAASGNILGTSLPNFDLTWETFNSTSETVVANGVYLFSESSPVLLHRLHQFILDESGRVADETHPPASLYQNLDSMSGEIVVDGSTLLVTIRPYEHGVRANPDHNIKWLFIHILDRSTIEGDIASSNTKVLISVICICLTCILIVSIVLWYSTRLIRHLSLLLVSFARFEFRQHLSEGKFRHGPIIFSELQEMQFAVLEMTTAFKRHLDTSRSGGRVLSSATIADAVASSQQIGSVAVAGAISSSAVLQSHTQPSGGVASLGGTGGAGTVAGTGMGASVSEGFSPALVLGLNTPPQVARRLSVYSRSEVYTPNNIFAIINGDTPGDLSAHKSSQPSSRLNTPPLLSRSPPATDLAPPLVMHSPLVPNGHSLSNLHSNALNHAMTNPLLALVPPRSSPPSLVRKYSNRYQSRHVSAISSINLSGSVGLDSKDHSIPD